MQSVQFSFFLHSCEMILSKSFVKHDCHRVRQVQRSNLIQHRNTDTSCFILYQNFFRNTGAFFSEHDKVIRSKLHIGDNDFWLLNEHVLFNVSNMLCGYNPTRVWNFIPFAGAGFGRTMTTNLYGMDLSAGILNTFRLSKHILLNLEVGYARTEGDVDGYEWNSRSNRGWDTHDNIFYGELGLTFNLGKATWNKVPDVDALKALHQSQLDALNAQLNDANAENARLKKLLAEQKPAPKAETKTVKEFVGTPVNVFFNLDKYNIASQKDLVNVQGIAKYAKDNGANLLVTGYADSATGKAPHNQWLSEKRAETVANELVKMGVSRDKIETAAKGGVNDLSPISFNRRATVQVK